MARVNVYLPDELASRVKKADLNVSAIAQKALEEELAGQETNEWLAQISARSYGVSHDQVIAALDAVRDENGW
jgi:post-segregation antitoxin (ccd killing protein)